MLPRRADPRLQGLEVGRSTKNLVAYDESRRAVDAQRSGKREILVDCGLDRGVVHVRLQAFYVQADGGGRLHGLTRIDRAADLIERSVKGDVVRLFMRGERRPRCKR